MIQLAAYFTIALVVLIIMVKLISKYKLYKEVERNREKPYRIVKNGLGEFILQHFFYFEIEDNGENKFYAKWENVDKFDTYEDALIEYNMRMNEHEKRLMEKLKEDGEKIKEENQKRLENTIVKVLK